MLRYIGKRLLTALLLIFGIASLTFFLLNLVPGDPVELMMNEHASPEVIARVREEMGLDDPLWQRYIDFLGRLLRGDLGYSYRLKRDVGELIGGAFPATLKLTALSLLFAWLIGIPSGTLSALRPGSFIDMSLMSFSLSGISMPVFWSALLLQSFFGLYLGWLPVAGIDAGIASYLLPALVLGWSSSGSIARLTRSSLLETLNSDYIRTAYAKGLLTWAVIWKHALQNAMLPVITVMAMQVAGLLSGSVLTESIFGIPGIGRISVTALQNRDLPLLQAAVIFEAVLVVFGNLLADLSYAWLDPRIRYD